MIRVVREDTNNGDVQRRRATARCRSSVQWREATAAWHLLFTDRIAGLTGYDTIARILAATVIKTIAAGGTPPAANRCADPTPSTTSPS
ncbi:MAG: hypothetical protein NZM34_10035, partial [Bernardetiaceae bacterium]|nr:hypothetical protein [Bernardetiaceae bacterium]